MYRLGMTPWEGYAAAAAPSVAAVLDREESGRERPPGRALDLGCGRGQYTPELARRGWDVVGVDVVPRAVEEARRRDPGIRYEVADVTDLPVGLGTFDLFLDIGCFQGLDPAHRAAEARGVTALANPGATVLMLAFGASKWRRLVEGAAEHDILTAFTAWELLDVREADTAGLGFPMNRTSPRWYRLGPRTVRA
ncbi:Methyltransferase domain-containing protein [Krasilnikoviella flava]|uniref:Methyltransferase domain-containing protein n=2 Tax=Krasilnikoviella flava TaxID=526729 RepID=A0A1T5L4N4_9MICO|nr:Methyltransferase domain-containing protein [Krasilnikoviella flava]